MKIICIHQSADLYGSDRSFLQVVKYLVLSEKYSKITVVLPKEGPLVDELRKLSVEIIYLKLSLLSKTYLKKLKWGKILFPLFDLRRKLKMFNSFDVVYVNTSVILDFYFLAPYITSNKIIHIREIPNKWLSRILSFFLKRANSKIVFNSMATKESFDSTLISCVVHNAFEGFNLIGIEKRNASNSHKLSILLIGRINNWKGQDFAIKALGSLKNMGIRLNIVGDTSLGNENIKDDLELLVKSLNLGDQVFFMDFLENPAQIFLDADLVIVPSRKPEPFGRIAIEAMSLGKPVIAANHGGLKEIVIHKKTGFLFTPNDIDSFNSYIKQYYNNPDLIEEHGNYALLRFNEKFSLEGFYRELDKVFN